MTDTTNDIDSIRAIIESWYRAMEAGDIAGLVSLVTPDVVLKPPGAPAVLGRDALEEALTTFLQAHSETVDFELEESEVSGRLAFARVRESATIRPTSGADAVSVSGMHLTILRRQPGGEWLIARDISSAIDAP